MNFKQWVLSIWSEANGNGSTTRILITAIFAFILGVGATFAVSTYQKKIGMSDFCNFLGSAGTFLVTTSGPLYLMNTAKDVLKNRDNKDSKEPNNQPGA